MRPRCMTHMCVGCARDHGRLKAGDSQPAHRQRTVAPHGPADNGCVVSFNGSAVNGQESARVVMRRADGKPIHVLVVDDEPVLAELVSMALRYEGWEIATAG